MGKLSSTRRAAVLVACASFLSIAALAQATLLHLRDRPSRMFLAPMIGVIEPCILSQGPGTDKQADSLARSCTGAQGSAAALVESTLGDLLPRDGKGQNRYELGYTLPVPLLKLFKPSGADWVINDEATSPNTSIHLSMATCLLRDGHMSRGWGVRGGPTV